MTKIVHRLVAQTAQGIAAEAWEILSSNDAFHRQWPSVHVFVKRQWRNFIGHARAWLVCMLAVKPGTENDSGGPTYLYPQATRDAVEEALLTEGAYKHVPQPHIPSAAEIARYGGLN